MTTPTTPEQAREAADLYRATGTPVSVTAVYSLADQVEELTKERDAYEKCADTMAAAHKVERDALKSELARPESTSVSLMRAENAALKDAARLALDALTNSTPDPMNGDDAYCRSGWKRHADASAALKAVL